MVDAGKAFAWSASSMASSCGRGFLARLRMCLASVVTARIAVLAIKPIRKGERGGG